LISKENFIFSNIMSRTIYVTNKTENQKAGPYPSNIIKSTKYTPYNFVFKNLFLQFQKVANVYFLCAGLLEVVPQFTSTYISFSLHLYSLDITHSFVVYVCIIYLFTNIILFFLSCAFISNVFHAQ
jgi:hypothetical protein